MNVRFEPLWGHAHLVPVLAAWHHAELATSTTHACGTSGSPRSSWQVMADPSSSDITWVAFDGDIPDEHNVLGSIS